MIEKSSPARIRTNNSQETLPYKKNIYMTQQIGHRMCAVHMPHVRETKHALHKQKKTWQILWKLNQCYQPLHVRRTIFTNQNEIECVRERTSIIAKSWSCLRGGGQYNSAEQNFSWQQLDILIVIDCHATSEWANVILHCFFHRPNKPTRAWMENKNKSHENDAENNTFDWPWHDYSMPPHQILYRLHRSKHVLAPMHGDQVKCKVYQIRMLVLATKSEITEWLRM